MKNFTTSFHLVIVLFHQAYLAPYVHNLKLPRNKINHDDDVYSVAPSVLTGKPNVMGISNGTNTVYYFFTPMKRIKPNSKVPVRQVTTGGFWKSAAKDTPIGDFGSRRHLNFHGPDKIQTNWIMHEYALPKVNGWIEDTTLCCIYEKGQAAAVPPPPAAAVPPPPAAAVPPPLDVPSHPPHAPAATASPPLDVPAHPPHAPALDLTLGLGIPGGEGIENGAGEL